MGGVNRISNRYSYQDNQQYNIARTCAANKSFNIFNPQLSRLNTLNNCGFVSQSGKVENYQVYKPIYKMTEMEKYNYIRDINSLSSDEQKIIEFNKRNSLYDYYGIVDKKTCTLKIYDKSGTVVDSYTVGIGETIGDGRPQIKLHESRKNPNSKEFSLIKYNKLTPAGDFVFDEIPEEMAQPEYTSDRDGKNKVISLRGDNTGMSDGQLAIHMTYKPEAAKRIAAIKSKSLEDNRMSFGCINLLEKDYDKMHSYLKEGCHIYVLPEEEGNKLELVKNTYGVYKFEQIYHREDPRIENPDKSSYVWYNVHPENAPHLKFQQREDSLQKLRKQYPNIQFY